MYLDASTRMHEQHPARRPRSADTAASRLDVLALRSLRRQHRKLVYIQLEHLFTGCLQLLYISISGHNCLCTDKGCLQKPIYTHREIHTHRQTDRSTDKQMYIYTHSCICILLYNPTKVLHDCVYAYIHMVRMHHKLRVYV